MIENIELWYTENHSDDIRFSIKVDKQVYSDKSDFQRIDIFETKELGKVFALDGYVMITEKDEFMYHEMIVHVPMAVNPMIRDVLVIGGGDGGTVRELARYNYLKRIDMVDIDKKAVEACKKYLSITACSYDDDRVNLYFEDGVKFISDKSNEYDLIIVDSTDPIGPGEGLFTKEFYNNCYRALKPEGILVNQHESPFYNMYAKQMKKAHDKIKDIFPICSVYQVHIPTYSSGHWLFGFASKKYDPVRDINANVWNGLKLNTKYYNTDIHVGSFMLPNYVKEMLEVD